MLQGFCPDQSGTFFNNSFYSLRILLFGFIFSEQRLWWIISSTMFCGDSPGAWKPWHSK